MMIVYKRGNIRFCTSHICFDIEFVMFDCQCRIIDDRFHIILERNEVETLNYKIINKRAFHMQLHDSDNMSTVRRAHSSDMSQLRAYNVRLHRYIVHV